MKFKVILLQLIGIVLLSSGCFAPRFNPPGELLASGEGATVCGDLVKRSRTVNSLSALVEATVSRSGEAASLRYVVLSRSPDRLRIDMLPIEGALTLGILTAREGRAVLLDAQERSYSIASHEQELLESFFGLKGITREVIIGLLSGVLPQTDCSSVQVYRSTEKSVALLDTRSHVVWDVDKESLKVLGCTILDSDESRIQISGERLDGQTNGRTAVMLQIYKPLEAQVKMLVGKMAINPALADERFDVAIPPSYRER